MSLLNLDLIEAIYSDAKRELTNDELWKVRISPRCEIIVL